jgi:hypothetical protein
MVLCLSVLEREQELARVGETRQVLVSFALVTARYG